MEQQLLILCTLRHLGALTLGQIERFLFGTGLVPAFDTLEVLAVLKENELVSQVLGPRGIQLAPNEKGEAFLAAHQAELPEETRAAMAEKSAEFTGVFQMEQNYLAQYSEQSSGIVPVSLSIRDGGKIVMKVSLIVRSTETAKKICDNWIKNSPRAYDDFWRAVAEGEPDPGFWTERPQ